MKAKAKTISMLFIFGIATYVFFRILQPDRFGNLESLFALIQQCFLPSIAACGFYFVLTMGMFDFSLGATIILSAMSGCLLSMQLGYIGLIVGSVAVGAGVGFFNGILYTKLKMPSIIVTIGLLIIYECVGSYISEGKVLTLGSDFRVFAKAPFNIILSIIAFALAYFILKYTKIGVYSNAIGANEVIAKSMGVDVQKYKTIGFMLCGLFAGIMSILVISCGSSIAPAANMNSMGRNFTPIMGCIIGLALKKYIHPVISIVIGEFIIAMIMNGLMTNGIDVTLQDVIVGLTLLIIVGITSISKKYEVVK